MMPALTDRPVASHTHSWEHSRYEAVQAPTVTIFMDGITPDDMSNRFRKREILRCRWCGKLSASRPVEG